MGRRGTRARIREPGYLAARALFDRRVNTPRRRPVVAVFLSVAITASASVEGRIVDPSSRAVPGARVLVVCGPSVTASSYTDGDGRFHVDAAPGRCELRV